MEKLSDFINKHRLNKNVDLGINWKVGLIASVFSYFLLAVGCSLYLDGDIISFSYIVFYMGIYSVASITRGEYTLFLIWFMGVLIGLTFSNKNSTAFTLSKKLVQLFRDTVASFIIMFLSLIFYLLSAFGFLFLQNTIVAVLGGF